MRRGNGRVGARRRRPARSRFAPFGNSICGAPAQLCHLPHRYTRAADKTKIRHTPLTSISELVKVLVTGYGIGYGIGYGASWNVFGPRGSCIPSSVKVAGMATKLTIRDIATLAGVSKATVSRVLNHKPDVDPTTRERVLQLIEQYGFVPSLAATGLAGGRTRLVGVLVPSLTWPLIPQVLQGIAETIEETEYELVLYSLSNERERNASITRILETRLTDGLIAVFPDGGRQPRVVPVEEQRTTHFLTELHHAGFPVVVIDDEGAPTDVPWIGTDNLASAREAVRHLIGLGHRRIAHITGPHHFLCTQERLDGYRSALEEAGLPVDDAYVLNGDFTVAGGEACGDALFASRTQPTAIFAANDQMAYGVLAAAERRGIRIPEDVALVGFDDVKPSAMTRPTLTTVHQPFDDMGKLAIALLYSRIQAPGAGSPPGGLSFPLPEGASVDSSSMRVRLPSSLVVRESCGASLTSRVNS